MTGLYIHVPFCQHRCHFCAFYVQIHRADRVLAYLNALHREIELHRHERTLGDRAISTVYFGGGTPTTLTSEELCWTLALVRKHFRVSDGAEITIEAAPDTLTVDGLKQLRGAGWNRLSLGIQSMEESALVAIGRRMLPDNAACAVDMARAAGFANINLDLIYGLPGQTLESWRRTLEETVALQPTHLACYALTVEQRTRLAVDVHRGDRSEPDADLQNAMEDAAADLLNQAGYERYEISNYCRPGYACHHNLLYWQNGEYLGLGPSAQSYLDGARFGNSDDLQTYCSMIMKGRLPVTERELLAPEVRRQEALVFGLRLTGGIPYEPETHEDSEQCTRVERLIADGLLERTEGRLRLTAMGRRFADSVALELY